MEFTSEGNYVNCSDKTPDKNKDPGFDKTTEKIINITSDNSNHCLNIDQLSFKDLFNSKYKTIMWTIFGYHIHNNFDHNLLLLLQ
jgi:hypothetical protein